MGMTTSKTPRGQRYQVILDSEKKLQHITGDGDTDDESADHVLCLQVHDWRSESPSLHLGIEHESSPDIVLEDDLDWVDDIVHFFFKLPASYPGGRPGFLHNTQKFFEGTEFLGITAIHSGQDAVKKLLAGMKKARKRSRQWSKPVSVWDCNVSWLKRSEHSASIQFKFMIRTEETVIVIVDEKNDEYQTVANSDPRKFINAMALPVRIWLRTRWWINCYNTTREKIEKLKIEAAAATVHVPGSVVTTAGPQGEWWEPFFREIQKKVAEKTAAEKEAAEMKILERLMARQSIESSERIAALGGLALPVNTGLSPVPTSSSPFHTAPYPSPTSSRPSTPISTSLFDTPPSHPEDVINPEKAEPSLIEDITPSRGETETRLHPETRGGVSAEISTNSKREARTSGVDDEESISHLKGTETRLGRESSSRTEDPSSSSSVEVSLSVDPSTERTETENEELQSNSGLSDKTVKAFVEPLVMTKNTQKNAKKKQKKKAREKRHREEAAAKALQESPSKAEEIQQPDVKDNNKAREKAQCTEPLQHDQAPAFAESVFLVSGDSPSTNKEKGKQSVSDIVVPATATSSQSSSKRKRKGKKRASKVLVPIGQTTSTATKDQSTAADKQSTSRYHISSQEQSDDTVALRPTLCKRLSPIQESLPEQTATPTPAISIYPCGGESSSSTTPVTTLSYGVNNTPQSQSTAPTSHASSQGAAGQPGQKQSGFFWELTCVGFTCAKADCEKRCNLWDGQSVICPKCGPYSEVRYCGKEHLREDVKEHWRYCTQWTFQHFCVKSSIPPDVLVGPPELPCRHNWDSPERHRQAMWFNTARNEGDYFIFADWVEQAMTGGIPGSHEVRCSPRVLLTVRFGDPEEKDRFRRALAIALFAAIEVQTLIDFMFRLIRDKLRSRGQWTSHLDAMLRYQMRYELGVAIQPSITGQRHACETEWIGLNPHHCRDPICSAERCVLLGDLGWGRGFRRLCEYMESTHWILRANRTTHPSVRSVEARTRGEGFDEILDEERRIFRRGEGWDGAGMGPMENEGPLLGLGLG